VIVLRHKRPDLERPYRVMGYPVVPILFVCVAVALLYSTLRSSPRESGIGLVIIAAGLPFYFHWKRRLMGNGDLPAGGDATSGVLPAEKGS
jgi:basic amino acid/polyamine antiporter, APA family